MLWTDDPVWDAEAYSRYLEKPQEGDLICDECGENITKHCLDYYDFDGMIYCPECVEKRRRIP